MTRNQKIFASIELLAQAEKLPIEDIVNGIAEALSIACRRQYGVDNLNVIFDLTTKRIKLNASKEVVDEAVLGEAFDPTMHIDINEAKLQKENVKIGDELNLKLKLKPEEMDRSTVSIIKQVFRQKIREAKYNKIVETYENKINKIVLGTLIEQKANFMYFKLPNNTEAVLPQYLQSPSDKLTSNELIPLVVEQIYPQSKKGPKVLVSRNHPKIVEYELTNIVPEIKDNIIEIKAIAREAGYRSKVSIYLKDDESDIDLIGTVVGTNGTRINEVKKKLGGENVDLIEYFDDTIVYISNALAPALVTAVQIIDNEEQIARVIVPDDQLSLAIGTKGQNVRLASQLTGWKMDILSESDCLEQGISYEDDII